MSTSKDIINYTDSHDVDEDVTTISVYDGGWTDESWTGIVDRNLYGTSTSPMYHVASSTVEFLNYTDLHVVDEDKMAIICKGGRFDMPSASGLFRTDLFDSPNKTATSVASYV